MSADDTKPSVWPFEYADWWDDYQVWQPPVGTQALSRIPDEFSYTIDYESAPGPNCARIKHMVLDFKEEGW